jgi:hypothetical protein
MLVADNFGPRALTSNYMQRLLDDQMRLDSRKEVWKNLL